MSTFTVFFCGTGSNKYDTINKDFKNGELISTLAGNCLGKEFAEWIIVDGPGSGNLQADDLFTKSEGYGMSGTAFGKGWHENVKHAIHVMKGKSDWQRSKLSQQDYERLKKAGLPIQAVEVTGSWLWRTYDYGDRKVSQQQLQEQIIKMFRKGGIIPTQVNLVGWSRGGISCHMLANAMSGDPALRGVPVNILAIDPVPGPLNFQLEKIHLGSNVKKYVGFYARDERSKGFACVIPKTAPGTTVNLYPMPGRHATLVGNASATGTSGPDVLPEPGQLTRHYAEVCLTRWGVSLKNKLELKPDKISALHQSIVKREKDFTNMHKQSYTLITENGNNERLVSHGEISKKFSTIAGAPLAPKEGLAATLAKGDEAYKNIT
jgi:hypothetical protein